MTIDRELLSILACPETKKNLVLADEGFIQKVNQAIADGKILNQLKAKVKEPIDGGLFREGDSRFLYPVRDGIPILLVEELLDVRTLDGQGGRT